MEILRRTKFPRLVKVFGVELPETILEHPQCNRYIGPLNDSLTFELFIIRT
jgi:hypothetical protein